MAEEHVDILFLNPPSPDGEYYVRDHNRSGRMSREGYIWPQTSLAYLAAMVDEEHSVALLDCIAEGIGWEECKAYILKRKPRYFVTQCISSTLYNDMYGTLIAKSIGSTTITMGCHVTDLTEETLRNFPTLDFIMRKEPEITFRELIPILDASGDLAAVKGLAFRQDGRVVINEDRPFLDDLDELPIPRHDLLPLDKYWMPFTGNRFDFVLQSRGCPYKCIFCRQPIMWERKVRMRSPGRIIEELKLLQALKVRSINFQSDTFTIDREWVIELCRGMVENGIAIKWLCNSRPDTVDPEMLRWMKKAGCWLIGFGIETGSQELLDRMKKEITLERIEQGIRWTHDAGIAVWGWFVTGLPGETVETMKETIRFSKKLPLDLANFAFGAPYPGTEFYEMAREEGWLTSDNWEDYDQNYSAIVSYPNMSNREIERWTKRAYWSWFLRPRPIIWLLKGVRDCYTLKFLFSIAKKHLLWLLGKREGSCQCSA